jgi:hypothetical protein
VSVKGGRGCVARQLTSGGGGIHDLSVKTNAVPRLHVPLRQPEEIIAHLGKPSHWKERRSGQLTAQTWHSADGLPASIAALLATRPEFVGAELVEGFLEKAVAADTPSPPIVRSGTTLHLGWASV